MLKNICFKKELVALVFDFIVFIFIRMLIILQDNRGKHSVLSPQIFYGVHKEIMLEKNQSNRSS